jgi:phosphatase NudJ
MHKPHVTVAAIVKHQDKFLVVKERDKHTGNICFNQPAGHLEQHETLAQAAKRELLEETGLNLTPNGFLGIYNLHANNGIHYLRFCFTFTLTDLKASLQPQDDDIISVHWHTLTELQSLPLRSPLVLQCFEDSLARKPMPLSVIFD